MGEVVLALGAISSVVQLIDFSTRLVKKTHCLLNDSSRKPDEQESIARLAADHQHLAKAYNLVTNDSDGPEEQAVLRQQQECNVEAAKLMNMLESLTMSPHTTGARKFREGAKKGFLAVRIRKDLERSRRHLDELNGLLGTSLLQLLNSRDEEQTRNISSLVQGFERLRDEAKVVKLHNGLESILNHILRSLSFGDMNTRVEAIENAFPETYKWAIESETLGLRTWLKSGTGMYWISGKAGSGKSTLMKYLTKNPEVRISLETWAYGTDDSIQAELTQAHFAFWYLGSSTQKSIEGLLRSLLYEIIQGVPCLGPIAFPDLYKNLPPPESRSTWSCDVLREALKATVMHACTAKPLRKFCFFIDGLDEFSGNQSHLLKLLHALVTTPNIKLCVASRPWNAFVNAFESRIPNLRLEDLTKNDIRVYVNGSIGEEWSTNVALYGMQTESYVHAERPKPLYAAENEEQMSELVEDIVKKAEGVFLWVRLVVDSVLSGLAEGDPISMLRYRVQQFPSDLEDFFEAILDRVDKVYRLQTYQALKLACLYVEENRSDVAVRLSSWIDFWILSQNLHGLQNNGFAYKIEPRVLSTARLIQMFDETRSFVSRSCKDLLYLQKLDSPESRPWIKVEFLHRTVYEFLSQHTIEFRRMMDQQVPDLYHNNRIHHLLNLARMKFLIEGAASHADLTENYVNQFSRILTFHSLEYVGEEGTFQYSTTQSFYAAFAGPHVLEAFISFGQYEYALNYLSDSAKRRMTLVDSCSIYAEPVIMAVFGVGMPRHFGVNAIHLPLVQALLEFSDIFNDFDFECYDSEFTIWQLFLQRWACSDEPLDLRQVWNIAKAFLIKNAPVHQVFDEVPGSDGTRIGMRVPIEAKDFLRQQIPSQWLLESSNECLLTECGHAPGDRIISERQKYPRRHD